jgi:erythromycin 3''-O-methyltransferase
MASTPRAPNETALLHHGGRPGSWGSLGLWADADLDYAGACSALARAVGRAARLQAGDSVLAVACGAGDELRMWSQDFGAHSVLGVELDPQRVAGATDLCAELPGVTVCQGSGRALAALGLSEARFDRVLCVDAAYHLRPRSAFLAQAWRLLRPGGTLAYTDLVLDGSRSAWRATLLAASARLCGLAADELPNDATHLQRLLEAGFETPQLLRLDDAVLGGFTRFVRAQSRWHSHSVWHPAWRRVALTARLIPPCRAAGLGYALLSAKRPGRTAGRAAFKAAATA